MINLNEIIPLLEKWEEFRKDNEANFVEFGKWLNNFSNKDDLNAASPITTTGERLTEQYSDNTRFLASYFITRLYKYIKIYTREIFSQTELYSIEDFSILALIDQMNLPSKKELCEANLTEITTGNDIIKRLIKNELAIEVEDNHDKRIKRIKASEKGKQLLFKIYNSLNNMEIDVLGDLDNDERKVIIKYLNHLDNFHYQYIEQNKR